MTFSVSNAYSHIDHGGMPDPVAEMEYKILLDFEPDNIKVRAKLGDVLIRMKKYKEAQREFLTVLSQDPKSFQAHMGLGQLLVHEKDWSSAEKKFLELHKLDPSNGWVDYFLGIIYKETGKYNEAKSSLAVALEKAKTNKVEDFQHLIDKINETIEEMKNQSNVDVEKPPL